MGWRRGRLTISVSGSIAPAARGISTAGICRRRAHPQHMGGQHLLLAGHGRYLQMCGVSIFTVQEVAEEEVVFITQIVTAFIMVETVAEEDTPLIEMEFPFRQDKPLSVPLAQGVLEELITPILVDPPYT